MKQIQNLSKLFLGGSLFLLSACGGNTSTASTEVEKKDAQKEFGCNVINVYNWGEYIGENTLSNFENMYNAKVNYDLFDSNELMYTKLLGGSSYDVIIPSDYTVERLIKEDLVQKLDKSQLTNLSQLDPAVVEMQKVYDPNLEYSVPYFRGSVGLVYNTTKVDPAVIEEKGWDILQDSEYKGRVFMYDSQRDAFMIAFKALGYSMNTESEEEIQKAYEWLVKMNQTISPRYVTDEVIDAMVNGDMDIAVMYSGDAAYVLSENEEMSYITPKQGTNIWSDAMVIPKNASCPGLANAFINYMTSYEAALDNSTTVGYTSTNLKVKEELTKAGGEYEGNVAYESREGYEKDEVFRYNQLLVQKLSDLWNKVKSS